MRDTETVITCDIKSGESRFNVYLAIFIAYLGPATAGFVVGWSSPSLVLLRDPDTGISLTEDQGRWLASLTPLGAAIGPLVSGYLLDSLGRRRTFLLHHVMFLVGWGLMCTKTLWIMYTARLLMGMAVGISLAVTSMYIGEMVDDSIRSTINCMYPVFNKFPLILTFGIGPHISYHNLIFICSVPSLAFMFLYKMLPESPLFLFLKNRDSEGIETLSWLRQLPESSVIDEAKSIKNSLSDKEEGSWANLFFRRSNLRAMMIVGSLQFFWQYSWGTVVIAYAQPILLQTGLSFSSSLCAWVMAIMTWIGASLAPVLVRSWGYKTSLMVSSTVCTLSMGTCAYFLGICLTGDNSPLVQWSVLISQILYTISNYSSYYPVSISLLGEYFEPSMKAKASTIITCVLCLESSFAVYIFPLFLRTFDLSITYWFSFAILFLGTMFVSIFIPETSGLSFAQIQEVLHR